MDVPEISVHHNFCQFHGWQIPKYPAKISPYLMRKICQKRKWMFLQVMSHCLFFQGGHMGPSEWWGNGPPIRSESEALKRENAWNAIGFF